LGVFCISTTNGSESTREICDQQSEDLNNAQGIIQPRESLRKDSTLTVTGVFHTNGTSCTDFVTDQKLTIDGTSDETKREALTFTAKPCFGFVATKLASDGSTQLTLDADELRILMTFCVELVPKTAGSTTPPVTVCDNHDAIDADPRPAHIAVTGLSPEQYVVNAQLKGACVMYTAPSAITIAPDPWTWYEAGMVFTPRSNCGSVVAPQT
jgi:hypothetical protein